MIDIIGKLFGWYVILMGIFGAADIVALIVLKYVDPELSELIWDIYDMYWYILLHGDSVE